MLLDNENENPKVHEWISKYTEEGELDIVTGYFTVGALAYLSKSINDRISGYRFLLGDLAHAAEPEERTLDLLNERITVEAALQLSRTAREAVAFLRQENVEVKTFEPNFCHAKMMVFRPADGDDRDRYWLTGSSNLTEAGIGLTRANNIELNIAETGNNHQYRELSEWFERLWDQRNVHADKTYVDESGAKRVMPFKEYLIAQIEKIFIAYSPKQVYYKMLFELFGSEVLPERQNPDFIRQVGRLETSAVYQALYEFQRKGVLSLISMLQNNDGAILADAVGLGKTWSALAVMKFYQLQDREVVLICPKKLRHNWHRYLRHQNSRFERDQFDYFIRYHTDLSAERMDTYDDRADRRFVSDKPKLFVIDESHNLRNGKSRRYQFLVNEMLARNVGAKVLLLSATPINNSLLDIRNQFKLLKQGRADGFRESLGIRNLDYTFNAAQHAYRQWREEDKPRIGDFIKQLPAAFFQLTDSLVVARTRKMIEGEEAGLQFPVKAKPENLFITPGNIGHFRDFEDLLAHFPPYLSGYQPSFYIEQEEDVDRLHDEMQRDRYLVKMLYILMIKRLESSWHAFHTTIRKMLRYHQDAYDKIAAYRNGDSRLELDGDETAPVWDEDGDGTEELPAIGRKRKIPLADIDRAGRLDAYAEDLAADIRALEYLDANLDAFAQSVRGERNAADPQASVDLKLASLMDKIEAKRASGNNDGNPKVIVFTGYRDTAHYLYEQLTARGFAQVAMVSGDGFRTDVPGPEAGSMEAILERFAPYTKLFKEKEWDFEAGPDAATERERYASWLEWVAERDPLTYEKIRRPIDLLIATDALSEGQNLQDCDMIINYDIHWNPVRVIQRMGRIDRIGSPNRIVFGINYWPSDSINAYLDLQGRVEQRMAMMKLAGSEVNLAFTDTLAEMAADERFEQQMNERMLRQMQVSWEDIETEDSALGFDNLSLESFRQDLLEELRERADTYGLMPNGIYSGFRGDRRTCGEPGIIALLGYPARSRHSAPGRYASYELVYIDRDGRPVLINQKEILDALAYHKEEPRAVPASVDRGEEAAIRELSDALRGWLRQQAATDEEQADGSTARRMGAAAKDVLAKLKTGDAAAIGRMKMNVKDEERFRPERLDLIAWMLVQ